MSFLKASWENLMELNYSKPKSVILVKGSEIE